MSAKAIKVLGIILLISIGLGVVGMIGFWFAHYIVMQEGYYGFGDSLMIAMCVCGIIHFVGYLGVPLVIVANNKERQEQNRDKADDKPKAEPIPIPALQQRQAFNQTNNLQSAPVVQNDYKYCSFCGYKHTKESNFCMKCGRKFP